MKRFFGFLLLSTATLALSACQSTTGPQSDAQDVPVVSEETTASLNAVEQSSVTDPLVTSSFQGGQLSWGSVGGILHRYAAIERNGEIYVCGAYARKGSANLSRLSREAMRQATVTANGQTISSNLSYFSPVSSSNWDNGLVGVQTNCRTTGEAAGSFDLDAVRVEMRSGRYRIRL